MTCSCFGCMLREAVDQAAEQEMCSASAYVRRAVRDRARPAPAVTGREPQVIDLLGGRRSCHRLVEPEQTISSQAHVRRAVDDNKLAAVALARLILMFAEHVLPASKGDRTAMRLPDEWPVVGIPALILPPGQRAL
jgi:hypothetical protein